MYSRNKSDYLKLKTLINLSQTGGTVYFTHDNGGKPFKVKVSKSNVDVYVLNSEKEDDFTYEHILNYKPLKTFIGDSDEKKFAVHGYCYPPCDHVGNSILLEFSDKYIHIGQNIFSFKTLNNNKIVDYCSPIGGNDVPYPYAVDSDGNVYLMTANVVIKNFYLEKKDYANDPYAYYYKSPYNKKIAKYDKLKYKGELTQNEYNKIANKLDSDGVILPLKSVIIKKRLW